ncbi:MAG: T9SS type A sorting domain-containing protein [Nonlabens sp.]
MNAIIKYGLAFLFISVIQCTSAQSVSFNNPALENALLNSLVIDTNGDGFSDSAIDTNNNGVIDQVEVNSVTFLSFGEIFPNITSFTGLELFPSLESLEIINITDYSLDLSTLPTLRKFKSEYYGFDFWDNSPTFPNINLQSSTLEELRFYAIGFDTLDFSNLTNLSSIDLDVLDSISSVDLSSNLSLTNVRLSMLNDIDLNISGLNLLEAVELNMVSTSNQFDFDDSPLLTSVVVGSGSYHAGLLTNQPLLESFIMDCTLGDYTSTQIDLSGFPILKNIYLSCFFNVSQIDFTNNPMLEEINMLYNEFNSIDLSNNANLKKLEIQQAEFLTTLDLTSNSTLEQLKIDRAGISSLDLGNLVELRELDLNVNLSGLNMNTSDLTNLEKLSLRGTLAINDIDVTPLSELSTFTLHVTDQISDLDLSNNQNLSRIDFRFLTFPSLMIDDNPLLQEISINGCDTEELIINSSTEITSINIANNPNLEKLYIRNGMAENLGFIQLRNLPAIEYICVDPEDQQLYESSVTSDARNGNAVVNSYCSFDPGGDFNTILGSVSIDVNLNGCDPIDPIFPNLTFTATDGNTTGIVSANNQGSYHIPVTDGQHNITPQPENPSYWNFSPASVTVDFPTQTSPFTQDFCVTPNGTVEDIEVIVTPIEQARPGFETDYKVVVKNKGNQNASGTVTLDYDLDYMTLFDSAPAAGTANSGQLDWSFTDIAPFQMEEYNFTMTLNTPTDSNFPLNGDDELSFTGTVTGTGTDNLPADNTMTLEQIVVNSFDPNDKRCLEGEKIEPSIVGNYVHYMIRFENTGNASAVNIVVKDAIDPTMFDVSTFVPLGGSHDYFVRTVEDGNTFEFIHENINLDFNDATNDGYVLFKIKTLPTLSEGDTFNNDAEIYFDFNAPIVTNDFVTTVQSTASLSSVTDDSIEIYPNPTSGLIQLNAKSALKSLVIHDLNGRLLNKTSFVSSNLNETVNLKNLKTGIYLMTVETSQGQAMERVVVE